MEQSSLEAILCQPLISLKVVEIQNIIRNMNQSIPDVKTNVSGTKAILVNRVMQALNSFVRLNRTDRLQLMISAMNNAQDKYQWDFQEGKLVLHQKIQSSTSAAKQIGSSQVRDSQQLSNNRTVTATYKYGPYFEVVDELTLPVLCESLVYMKSNRAIAFTLTTAQQQLIQDGAHEVRLFCSKYDSQQQNPGLLEFPEICEIKVNGTFVLAGQQLRGIKGSPGTIHPPDITSFIQLPTRNVVEIHYASNVSDFVACVRFVRRRSVESLVDKLVETQTATKEDVVQKFVQNQEEADVVIEFQTLSMKCPLAFSRIQTPIRASTCSHAQCFDAYTFLKMNEQTPTWSCPACSRSISYNDLIVDGYFKNILDTVGRNADTVRIGANGELQQIKEEPDLSDGSSTPGTSSFVSNNRSSSIALPFFDEGHDNDKERRSIEMSASVPPPFQKQSTSNVIDLTSSDNEGEPEQLV